MNYQHHARHPRTGGRLTMRATRTAPFEVRRSPLHGMGVFAVRRINKGTRVIEYLGERISHAQADAPLRGQATRTTTTRSCSSSTEAP